MSTALIQSAFSSGELSPALFGRVDLAQWHQAAATMRNMVVNYRGGASSRAGTLYVGRAKQSGTALPPRLIPFRFSITQSYALEFGDQYIRVIFQGGYVTESPMNITGITSANPAFVTIASHGYSNGDWVFIQDVGGMTEVNNRTFIVANATTNSFSLVDMFGVPVNSLSFGVYTSGGTASRIYTLSTPYAVADLPALKFTQSADVMSLTHPSYPPYDLTRVAANSWSISAVTFASAIAAPGSAAAAAKVTTTTSATQYAYVVTAVASDGEESVASPVASVTNSVQISATAGSVDLIWSAVTGSFTYNIYKAPPSYNASVPTGTLFGYIGSSLGLEFVDTNILQDMSRGPPLHLNPFAPGQVIAANVTAAGSSYTSQPTATVNSSTGTGASLSVVLLSSAVAAIIVNDSGSGYTSADTITISGGGGSGATATLTIGPATGIYPSVVSYFQERRVYGGTNNNPDTYWMTQPGLFTNMDQGVIPVDSDAIVGTPWAQQVNGIQALVPMPGGLVVFTGLGVWQVAGQGGATSPITPSAQSAQPQAANGCSPTVLPINIGYDILYVQAKGYTVRDISYNLFANIYTGTDLSVLSDHLFLGHTIKEWAWSEEPYKIIWAVRDDGILLSLTYLKEQEDSASAPGRPQSTGWARHDTNGQFISVCSVSEPPVDATYVVVKRYIQGGWLYYIERMDNRIWPTIEDCWCVDSGLSYPSTSPAANLTASTATSSMEIGSVTVVTGGAGYTAPVGYISDLTGTGAEIEITCVAGIITAVTVTSPGSGYSSPKVIIEDPTGLSAVLHAVISNPCTFVASAAIFSSANLGDVIRMGGGSAVISAIFSSTQVTAEIVNPILLTLPNDPNNMPLPAAAGDWTLSTPTLAVSGLNHLEGMTISILADGSVVPQQTVVDGTITLSVPASQIVIGLPYQVQLQSLYTDIQQEATIQGKRKNIYAVTVRVSGSRGIKVGSNQIDQSVQPYTPASEATWKNLVEVKQNQPAAGTAIPLYTGDQRVVINGNWAKPGQVAVQQDYPLPCNILAFIPEIVIGDSNG